jgi:WD40 repeat protein
LIRQHTPTDTPYQDLRDLTRSILRLSLPSGVRAVAFSPDNTHALQLNLGLDDGSLQRVDLRLGGTKGVLDRLPVAHAGPILSLDWVPPSGMPLGDSFTSRDGDSMLVSGRNPAGWIASAGLDKTVKVRR